jgi:tRNA-splicing endonuclease subunit Sen2
MTELKGNGTLGSERHANGTPMSNDTTNATPASTPAKNDSSSKGTPKPRGPRRPNYNEIHARKLPLDIYPLPTFQPHNPLSLVPFLLTVIRDFVLPRSSHAKCPYHGSFSSLTRSVHVTDPATVRGLWESGFFGKGILSRSEPNWLEGEKRRVGLLQGETAEQFSARRRGERMIFKRDRARIEKELIEELRVREAAGLVGLPSGEAADQIPVCDKCGYQECYD